MFHKLLIANRGEIACRIARTARRLGVAVAAVYSPSDARARHVRVAEEAWPIGADAPSESYLNVQAILEVARRCGADAIHPGYGFLSENASFAAACEAAGFAFIGPPAASIAAMGDKAAAKGRMRRAGVPVLPDAEQGADGSLSELVRRAYDIGFPIIVKPVAGGGGKGMQIVREAAELIEALEAARRIAAGAFADDRLLLERYVPNARHIEVQILADRHGRVVHVLDRDCSIQRRYQKLIEEAPAQQLAAPVRSAMADAACRAAREVGYIGAGTVEFLFDGAQFFFLEMNTRLQVEHTVTEAVTGIDLVEWQLRIAAGEPLALEQRDIAPRGHAIEARVCAEDPARDFAPAAGELRLADWPAAQSGLRVDQGFETGDTVSIHYDSLLGKLIAAGPTRALAVARLLAGLRATYLAGLPSNVEWLAEIVDSDELRRGPVDTEFLERHRPKGPTGAADPALVSFAAAAVVFAMQGSERPMSPWALVDGFRLGGADPVTVRLGNGDDMRTLDVRVYGRSRVRVDGLSERVRPEKIELIGSVGHSDLKLRGSRGGSEARALIGPTRVDVWRAGRHAALRFPDAQESVSAVDAPEGSLAAMLPGVVVAVRVSPGEAVSAGQELIVLEAMKMEHKIRSPGDGVVEAVHVRMGERVTEGRALVTMAALAKKERA